MVAIVRIDTQLIDHLERILAPIPYINQRVIEGRTVIPGKAAALTEDTGRRKNIRCDNLVQQASKLAVSKGNSIQLFKLLPEIGLKSDAITDIRAILILQVSQLFYNGFFEIALRSAHRHHIAQFFLHLLGGTFANKKLQAPHTASYTVLQSSSDDARRSVQPDNV